jgi:hypothetical protein
MHFDQADANAAIIFGQNIGSAFRADEGIFLARQLDYVKARVYEAKLPPLTGLQLVPQTSEVPEWAATFTYQTFTAVGMAKVIANYADDLPRADVKGVSATGTVKDIGDSYGYNIAELRASSATGENLPQRKANAARRAIDLKLNQIALIGEPAYGLYGLTTHPNIGLTVIAGDWANVATTADAILLDLDSLWNAVRTQSHGLHTPNRIALPSLAYGAASSKRLTDALGETAMTFFIKKHPGFEFFEAPELETAGTGGVSLAIMYEYSPENLSMEVPMPFNQLPAQARNLELVVDCLARAAGVVVYYPLALTKAEGV